jgi:ABC-2 type transport system permease protein
MLTTILLWEAIYAGSPEPADSADKQLAGFTLNQMIAYLLLVHIARMFSSMPGLAYGIARDIRDGSLKKYLLQPLDMLGYLVSYRAAHKAAYIATASIPYGLLFFLCRDYFRGPDGDFYFPDGGTFLAFLVSLVLGFVVGFFFEACIGTIGFWFLEVTSLLYVMNTLAFFISGQMFPLDLLPPFWAGLLKVLPFQYMAYFPAAVFLGKISGVSLVYGLLGEVFWAVFFIVLARGLYRLGLRRYSAYGG